MQVVLSVVFGLVAAFFAVLAGIFIFGSTKDQDINDAVRMLVRSLFFLLLDRLLTWL